MAQRRMFSREITDSDAFLNLSLSAQCLYFHCGLAADDEGFVSAGKRIARAIGASEKDLDELVKAGFLIPFPDSGVYVIVHFMTNNYIRADRKQNTVYQREKKLLDITENNYYKLRQPVDNQLTPNCQPDGSPIRLDYYEDSIDNTNKESINKVIVDKGSPEGADLRESMIFTAVMAGIPKEEITKAYDENGYDITHDAFVKWKEDGKKVGKYVEFLREELQDDSKKRSDEK